MNSSIIARFLTDSFIQLAIAEFLSIDDYRSKVKAVLVNKMQPVSTSNWLYFNANCWNRVSYAYQQYLHLVEPVSNNSGPVW